MKVLITGSSGLIGSEVAMHFDGLGWEIHGVDNNQRAGSLGPWQTLNEGWDCVFGSRFMKGGGVIDYPRVKLLLNRMANWFVRILFRIKLNDTTNAFKAYRREVIEGCMPILSPHLGDDRRPEPAQALPSSDVRV